MSLIKHCILTIGVLAALTGTNAVSLETPKPVLVCNNRANPIPFEDPKELKPGMREMTSQNVQFDIGLGDAKPGAVNVDNNNTGSCSVDMSTVGEPEEATAVGSYDQGGTWMPAGAMSNIAIQSVPSKSKSKVTWYIKSGVSLPNPVLMKFTVVYHPN
jgi:hypothetical protein